MNDRQKQIEVMANDIYKRCPDLAKTGCGGCECVSCLTYSLYSAGYRKHRSDDVVEVVRCKDCKYCTLTKEGEYNPEDIVCGYFMTDGMQANDFCSYGERREK